MKLRVLFVIVACFTLSLCDDQSTSCAEWENIEKMLKRQDEHSVCSKEDNCSGMNCSANISSYSIQSGIKINSCAENTSLTFSIDIPKWGIKVLNKTIQNGDIILLKGGLKLEFAIRKSENSLNFGLNGLRSLGSHEYENKLIPSMGPLKFPILPQFTFPIPSCVSTKSDVSAPNHENISALSLKRSHLVLRSGGERDLSCSITNDSCMPNELCLQTFKSEPYGMCVCISNYKMIDGVCIYHPTQDTSTENPGGPSGPKHDDSNVSLLLTAILVPITVILMVIGIVYGTIRFRICQHLRRRLRVQVYEHVNLGQDDDTPEPESSNPVV